MLCVFYDLPSSSTCNDMLVIDFLLFYLISCFSKEVGNFNIT